METHGVRIETSISNKVVKCNGRGGGGSLATI